jgi:antitoxin component YwqK of YwqJK toxin-antitoxin module
MRNGLEKEYYTNGNLKSETTYINDERNANHKRYYENGNIERDVNYNNG